MTVRKMLRAAGLATAAVALGQLALSQPAAAAPTPVPPAVTAWFTTEAAGTAAAVLGGTAVQIDEANAAAKRPATAYRAGTPTPLHGWNPGFVAGQSDAAVVEIGEWVAPLYRDGAVAGTIAATRSTDGAVTMSYVDDDVAAGTALASGVSGDVVQDPQLGGLVEVGTGHRAKGLSATAGKQMSAAAGTDLRKVVADAHRPSSWAPDEAGAGRAETGGGNGQLPVVLLIAGAVALLWLFAPRRAAR